MVKIDNIELPNFPLLLAPMEDVSDPPFRALCKKHGADLMYTEFISSEGLIRDAAKSVQKRVKKQGLVGAFVVGLGSDSGASRGAFWIYLGSNRCRTRAQ